MEAPLSELANTCVDFAAALDIFLDNTRKETSIRDSIEDLMSLSKVLYALYSGLSQDQFRKNAGLITHDLDLVLRSLQLTFDDVRRMLADTRFTHPDGRVPYRALWDGMNHLLTQHEGVNLSSRLDRYNKFLEGLLAILQGGIPIGDMVALRERFTRLLKEQILREIRSKETPFNPRAVPLRAQTPGIQKLPPTFRPQLPHFQTYPAPGITTPPSFESQSPTGRLPGSPVSSLNSWDSIPPYVGDVPLASHDYTLPQSPVYSDSSQATWNSSSTTAMENPHWGPRVMTTRHPRTPFNSVGPPTKCDAREDPTAIQRLRSDGFVEVFKCSFPDTKAVVKLFWRKDDHRSRILYVIKDPRNQRPIVYCMPMVSLKLVRSDSCLQLCRYDSHTKQLQRWGNLHFADYERMTLFQCTYRAMKHQDSKRFPEALLDYPHPSEEMEFSAEIQDDQFRHILRILRDTDSGCVRLEASALRGEMKGVPIWTAFVTDFIGSKTWMRQLGPNTIRLGRLEPYVFCVGYTPCGQSDSHAFQLKFKWDQDATSFMERFNSIYE